MRLFWAILVSAFGMCIVVWLEYCRSAKPGVECPKHGFSSGTQVCPRCGFNS